MQFKEYQQVDVIEYVDIRNDEGAIISTETKVLYQARLLEIVQHYNKRHEFSEKAIFAMATIVKDKGEIKVVPIDRIRLI